jgi:hypothetical protein
MSNILQFAQFEIPDGFVSIGNPRDFVPRYNGLVEEWTGDLASVSDKDGREIAGLVSFGPGSVVVDAEYDDDGVIVQIRIIPIPNEKIVVLPITEEVEVLTLPGAENDN